MTRTEARTAEAASALHLIAGGLAAENIQTIDEVKHAIAVHAVIFVHRAAACSQRTADVTLLLQNVVHLEADGGIPFRKVCDNCAFQISSLRFILLSVYPRRLWLAMLVESVMFHGMEICVLAP